MLQIKIIREGRRKRQWQREEDRKGEGNDGRKKGKR